MLEIVCAILIVFTSVFLLYLRKKNKGDIPGPPGWPIIGNTFDLPKSGPEMITRFSEMMEKYGRTVKLSFGPVVTIVLTRPEDAEIVLKSTKEMNKSHFYNFLSGWLGNGLLLSAGDKWITRRKAITPSFHFNILDKFTDVFNKKSSQLVDQLKERQLPSIVDVLDCTTRYTLDVICETAMGVQMNAVGEVSNEYIQSVRSMCEIVANRVRTPIFLNEFFWFLFGQRKLEKRNLKVLHGMTQKIIKEKEEIMLTEVDTNCDQSDENEQTGIRSKIALLEMLLSQKLKGSSTFKTNDDINEEVNTFLFEGHDTTTSGICFTLEMIARHQSVQDQVYKEIVEVLQGREQLSHADLNNLNYLERVVKESLRLYPPVPSVARQLTNELKLPSGYTLPAHSSVAISIFFLHRDAEHFKNPNEFNPDNFLADASSARHPYAYIPFSAGPRNCIGQRFAMLELKSIIGKIVRNFRVRPVENAKPVQPYGSLILRSVGGHKLLFEKR